MSVASVAVPITLAQLLNLIKSTSGVLGNAWDKVSMGRLNPRVLMALYLLLGEGVKG